MSQQSSEAFEILVREGADDKPLNASGGDRADFIKISDYLSAGKVTVPKQDLSANVKTFLGGLQDVFSNPPEQGGNFTIDSITVTAEVSAKGTLNLLGTGGEIGGKGGITFVFKRKQV
ncbi:MAG: hypothetical protein H7039_19415 [Bryobacteraceae bacterium]|nr:hypothetical protein [Bryobacteraceae bacterium]